MAVFTLPPEMIGFFKKHVEYLSEHSVDPDRRAHVIEGEASRHYMDIENFGENPFSDIPHRWQDAIEKYSEDSLKEHGVLAWHIYLMMGRLTKAFEDKDVDRIIYNASNIGHYIADACTPLHTTIYYNGRNPEEKGIHSLWESRLPELFGNTFDYMVGRAEYIHSPQNYIWQLIETSHLKVDTIYEAFNIVMKNHSSDKVFSHEIRGRSIERVYSAEFSTAFHQKINYMVERQMQLAVKAVGDLWYSSWVNAGQPNLYRMEKKAISRKHRRLLKEEQQSWDLNKITEGQENQRLD